MEEIAVDNQHPTVNEVEEDKANKLDEVKVLNPEKDDQQKPNEDSVQNTDKPEENQQQKSDKPEEDEFAYLKHAGFSSEGFKIEVKNLPKFYGYAELKKLISNTLSLNASKIKIPKKNSSFAFVCLRSDDGE